MTKEATLYTTKVENETNIYIFFLSNETNIFIYEETLVTKGRDCSKKKWRGENPAKIIWEIINIKQSTNRN